MNYEHLLYEVDDEHMCWVALSRSACINAFTTLLCGEL